MPAAAVIPALIAYIKVVAVKKLVVGLLGKLKGWWNNAVGRVKTSDGRYPPIIYVGGGHSLGLEVVRLSQDSRVAIPSWVAIPNSLTFYLEQIRVFKAGLLRLNSLAWNNGIGLESCSLVFGIWVMINRDGWGRLYSVVRGEILGFTEDKHLRKHSASTCSLIKNES